MGINFTCPSPNSVRREPCSPATQGPLPPTGHAQAADVGSDGEGLGRSEDGLEGHPPPPSVQCLDHPTVCLREGKVDGTGELPEHWMLESELGTGVFKIFAECLVVLLFVVDSSCLPPYSVRSVCLSPLGQTTRPPPMGSWYPPSPLPSFSGTVFSSRCLVRGVRLDLVLEPEAPSAPR